MPLLTLKALEQATYIMNVAFTDEDGASQSPNTLTWTLTDELGNIVNSRDAIPVTTPTASEDIVLKALDLEISTAYHGTVRVFTIEGTYDSSIESSLPYKEYTTFDIEDLVAVP